MRKWEFSPREVRIIPAEKSFMELELKLKNTQWPSVEAVNSAMRFLYTEILVEHPTTEGVFIGPVKYNSYPPGSFFRLFDMISPQDEMTIFLWGSFAASSEEFPLPGSYNSRFLMSFIGASGRPDQISKYKSYPGLISSWTATFIDVFLFGLLDIVTGVKPSATVMVSLYSSLFGSVENIVSAAWASTDTLPQIINSVITSMVSLLEQPKIAELIEAALKLRQGTIKTVVKNLGPVKIASVIIGVINMLLGAGDLLRLDSYEMYLVDIPIRRKPMLRTDTTQAYVSQGGRVKVSLELIMPEGYIFSFSDDPFQARVFNQAAQDQQYRFEDITVQNFGGYTVLPISLTLKVRNYGSSGIDVGVRPKIVNSQAMVDTYYFPEGLGNFIQGIQEGGGDVIAQIELSPGTYPKASGKDRFHSVAIPVRVDGPLAKPVWNTANINSMVGSTVSLGLEVRSTFYPLYTETPFTSKINFSQDRSTVELYDIYKSNSYNQLDPSRPLYPYKISITASGTDLNGKTLMRFAPKPWLIAAANAGTVYFENGLRDILKMLRPGSGTLTAKLYLDPGVFDEIPQSEESIITVNIQDSNSRLVADKTQIDFNDKLFDGFTVEAILPGGMSFNTAECINAQVDFSSQHLYISNISDDPYAEEPVTAPVNLSFEITGNPVVEFSYEKIFSQSSDHYISSKYIYGSLTDFIKAKQSGSSVIKVSAVAVPEESDWLKPPESIEIVVNVAEGAKPVLEKYYEFSNNSNEYPKDINGDIEIWKYGYVIFTGHVDNYSKETDLRLFVNDVRQADGSFDIKDNGSFVVNVSGLKEGRNNIRIEAEKTTNFGVPGTVTAFVNVPKPEINTTPDDLQVFNGKKNVSFKLTCKHTTKYTLTLSNNVKTTDKTIENTMQLEELVTDESFQLEDGNNLLTIKASNAVTDTEKTITIVTHKPEVWFTEIKGFPNMEGIVETYAITNGYVNIYESPVNVKGSSKYCDVTLEKERIGPADNRLFYLPRGDFSQEVDFILGEDYKLKLTGKNDFGTVTKEIRLNRSRIKQIYNWNFTYNCITPGVKADFTIYNPQNGSSTQTGPTVGSTFGISYEYLEGSPFYNGNLFIVNLTAEPGIVLSQAEIEFLCWGQVDVQFNGKSYKFEIVGAIKPEFIIEVIEYPTAPPSGWDNDGFVRFRSARIHPWFSDGNAAYDIGRRL